MAENVTPFADNQLSAMLYSGHRFPLIPRIPMIRKWTNLVSLGVSALRGRERNMSPMLQTALGIGSCLILGWLMFSNTSRSEPCVASQDDVIDPSNSYQIGFLVGMTGGSVTDASVVRYAVERFEQMHGYKATLRDAAVVVGLMQSGREI